MTSALAKMFAAARDAVDRHGGGWAGVWSVATRSYQVARSLGVRGLLRRVDGAASRTAPPPPPDPGFTFPAPLPLEAVTQSVGVMAHVFYPDLIDEFAEYLQNIPKPFVLMVSVMDEQAKALAEARFSRIQHVVELHVRTVPNRGRDIAPLLVTFREEVLAVDVLCHIHTKKSLYTGSEQEAWRKYLLESLLGSSARVAGLLGMFQATPQLGMMYPESFRSVPLFAHTWLANVEVAHRLGDQLGIAIDPSGYIDYPVGSMFWARVSAIRPLYDLGLTTADFPIETGQTDGTLQHALERLLAQVVQKQNLLLGVLPTNGELTPSIEGARNWHTYFDVPIRDQIIGRAADASIVSFDIFDTLVMRPFLTPNGSRGYLEHRVKQELGLDGFAALRQKAETRARIRSNTDVDLAAIYDAIATLPEAAGVDIKAIQALELQIERDHLRVRTQLCASAGELIKGPKHVIGLSDMYLREETLRDVLPPDACAAIGRIYVSCDTGWRKDTGDAWQHLPTLLQTDRASWMHVGDNEHSDKQRPHDMGFIPPAHVLRPAALLDVVPALRPLRPNRHRATRWPDQLWLGLVANRFASLADRTPGVFNQSILLEDASTLGYVALGPLVLDYLTWATRSALEKNITRLLFLSREGYLLEQAFQTMKPHLPSPDRIEGTYLLASRRAIGTATLRRIEDVERLLSGRFTGTLDQLLRARLGDPVAHAVSQALGSRMVQAQVFLPEMRAEVVELLRPAAPAVLERAEMERDAYLAYWSVQAGNERVMLSDVGYAGTIQTHLARLTGQALVGAYFALNADAAQTSVNGGEARARFHDGRETGDTDCPVLRHDLLLESVLTAPTPQFSHFERNGEQLVPHYAKDDDQLRRFAVVAEVHEGVKAFIEDACAVVGKDILQLEFDPRLVQQPLRCVGSGLWRPGAWGQDLKVDDHYTGRGVVTTRPAAPA